MSNVTGPFNLVSSHTMQQDSLGVNTPISSLFEQASGLASNDPVAPEATFDLSGPSGM